MAGGKGEVGGFKSCLGGKRFGVGVTVCGVGSKGFRSWGYWGGI